MRHGPGGDEHHRKGSAPADRAVAPVEPAVPVELHGLKDQARTFIASAKAPNTLRAYGSDWRYFTAWCACHQLAPMPAAPEAIALYLAALAQDGHKASTIQRRLTAISQAHQAAGFDSPSKTAVVRETHKGIRRAISTRHEGKAPTLTADVRAMVDDLPAVRGLGRAGTGRSGR